ncbi:hypothetical protein Tsubulata_021518 [Turnera subulata]|uniref:Uncharacterized protein n=1 Tax=Turnera subulata TaxID=218843 RepID=A0A9Q0FTA4_9ROSI|nr:hypothetical protein Tsubulata_021518 [Turnera subulata]
MGINENFSTLPFILILAFSTNPRRFLRIPVMSLAKPSSPDHGHRHSRHQFATPAVPLPPAQAPPPIRLLRRLGRQARDQERPQPLARARRGRDLPLGRYHPADPLPQRYHRQNPRPQRHRPRRIAPGVVRRQRPGPVKPDENPEEAAFSAIRKELGSVLMDSGVIRIVPGSYKEKTIGWEDEEEKRESRKDAVDEPVEERVGRDGVVGGEVEDSAVLVNGEDEPFQRGA